MEKRVADQAESDARPQKERKAISMRPRIRKSFYALDPYTRHKILINEYRLNHPGATALLRRDTSTDKTDYDVLVENHRFLWPSDDEDEEMDEQSSEIRSSDRKTWGQRLAKKYYDSLFKEFTICDLSRYKEDKVAMRWRTEAEVVDGKGQFVCGEKRCSERNDLRTWEVNFKYEEDSETKNTLVKLRLCPTCSHLLNFKNQKKEIRHKKRGKKKRSEKEKREKSMRRKRQKSGKGDSSSWESSSSCDSHHDSGSKSQIKRRKSSQSHEDADPAPGLRLTMISDAVVVRMNACRFTACFSNHVMTGNSLSFY